MRLSTDDNESFKEAIGSLRFNNPTSDPNALQRVPVTVGSSSSMQLQEGPEPEETRRSEDICFNNPPSGPNILQQLESGCSMSPQDRIENIAV